MAARSITVADGPENHSRSMMLPRKRPRAEALAAPIVSLTLAPATPMPIGEYIALSAVHAWYEMTTAERSVRSHRQTLRKELDRYRETVEQQEERQREQQRASSARIGARLFSFCQRQRNRRAECYRQLVRVEFDAIKRTLNERKQEDLLQETEALTKKLLNSILHDQNSSNNPVGSNSNSDSKSDETGDALEMKLSLLDTQNGARPLRDYQRSALRWMIHLYDNNLNGILADEMGLGKTVQTIALLAYFAEYKNDWGPHLIVVPTTVVLNWKAELARWCPGFKVITYIGSQKERAKLRRGWSGEDAFHVCVTSYNLVVRDRTVFRRRPWGFLVLDEAHHIKNFMSNKWQALFDLQAQYRLLLTGTPLQNSVMELWSLFHFLLPFISAFRSNEDFREWFSNPMEDMVTGRVGLNEEIVRRLQALLRPFMLRRLKKDVESQLPSKSEKVVVCRLSRRQRFLYDDFMQLAETRQRLAEGGAGGVLGVLLALRKVCNHPDLFAERPIVSPFVLSCDDQILMDVPRCCLLLHNDTTGIRGFWSGAMAVEAVKDARVNVGEREEEDVVGGRCFSWVPRGHQHLVEWDVTPAFIHAESDSSQHHFGLFGASPNGYDRVCGGVSEEEVQRDSRDQVIRRFLFPEAMAAAASRCEPLLTLRELKEGGGGVSGSTSTQQNDNRDEDWSGIFSGHCHSVGSASTQRWKRTIAFQMERVSALRRSIRHVVSSQLQDIYVPSCERLPSALCPTLRRRAEAITPLVTRITMFVPAAVVSQPPSIRCREPVHRFRSFTAHTRESLAPLLVIGQDGLRTSTQRRHRRHIDAYDDRNRSTLFPAVERPLRHFDASSFASESWPAHVRHNFSFPDKNLLIHDCGKLQYLQHLLKRLRQEGHRMLIFTQFVAMLNILERFLALGGIAYLRIDGSTKAELRQAFVDRFNEDARVTCMILSTRSGGIGLNLTGADTVIFYDSDWNPTMDLQAQDRCHRIGQTRPVTIYRLISEHTVEEKILQKARERKKLNNIVIRGGQFHAIAEVKETFDDSAAAFVALSDPVSLRSFFHDLDEDATVVPAPTPAAAVDWEAEMTKVEDEEDRAAQRNVEMELRQMEEEARNDAAEVSDGGGGGDGTEAEAEAEGVEDESDTGPLSGKREELQELQRRSLDVAGELNEAVPHSPGNGIFTSAAPPAAVTSIIQQLATQPSSTSTSTSTSTPSSPQRLSTIARKRREILQRQRTTLDIVSAVQYGELNPREAREIYGELCDEYGGVIPRKSLPSYHPSIPLT